MGLTEHAMASSAAASNRGEAHNTADWLSCTLKKAIQKRHDGVVDLLGGAKLQPVADELGLWAYRLENASPADMRNKLATLTHESFDPTNKICEAMRRRNK